MIDVFQVETRASHSGSYTDDIIVGNFVQVDPALSGGFLRRRIGGSALRDFNIPNFNHHNLSFVRRLSLISGSAFSGVSSILGSQTFSTDEFFYDSFVPAPVNIAQTNNVSFPYIGDSGSLGGSALHGIPGTEGNGISLFLSDRSTFTVQKASPSLASFVDFDWTTAKWPFRSKYKSLQRLLTPSLKLPGVIQQTVDFEGNAIFPPSSSNILGSVYYVADARIQTDFGAIIGGISNPTEFKLDRIPIIPTGSHAYTFFTSDCIVSPDPTLGTNVNPVMLLGGGNSSFTTGSVLFKCVDGLGFFWENITPANIEARAGGDNSIFAMAHSVTQSGNDAWSATVVGGNDGLLYVNTTDRNPTRDTVWVDKSSGITAGINDIAFNDPTGLFSAANFVAVAGFPDPPTILTSSDRLGTSWESIASVPTTENIIGVCYSTSSQRFIACTLGGFSNPPEIIRSNDRLGSSWSAIGSLPTTNGDMNAIACHGQTVIAVGDTVGSPVNPIIWRSLDGGLTWANVSPSLASLGLFQLTLHDVKPGRPHDDIDWIVAGLGVVLISKNNGTTWELVPPEDVERPLFKTYQSIISTGINAFTNRLEAAPRYVLGAASHKADNNIIFRGTNLISNGYFTGSNGDLINEVAVLHKNSAKAGRGIDLQTVPLELSELYKIYFGNGNGIDIDFSAERPHLFSQPFKKTYFRNRSPGIIDRTIYDPGDGIGSIESVRTHGSVLRSWGYGIMNASPTAPKCIFNKRRFGHLRDMFEQRLYSKILSTGDGRFSIGQSPVTIRFVSGTLAQSRSLDYQTNTNPSYNPTDSGEFDFEAKSGQPFFDDIDLIQFR